MLSQSRAALSRSSGLLNDEQCARDALMISVRNCHAELNRCFLGWRPQMRHFLNHIAQAKRIHGFFGILNER